MCIVPFSQFGAQIKNTNGFFVKFKSSCKVVKDCKFSYTANIEEYLNLADPMPDTIFTSWLRELKLQMKFKNVDNDKMRFSLQSISALANSSMDMFIN